MLMNRVGLGLIARQSTQRSLNTVLKSSSLQTRRSLNTIVTTHDKEQEILVAQRKNRPSSPHLTIYQPQITWYLSSVHRISGVVLALGFYGVTVAYALTSVLGIHFDSNTIVDAFHSLSPFTQISIKSAATFPFFFHFANGLRHLVWDTGKELTLKGVYRTGYAVLAFTALGGVFYSFF